MRRKSVYMWTHSIIYAFDLAGRKQIALHLLFCFTIFGCQEKKTHSYNRKLSRWEICEDSRGQWEKWWTKEVEMDGNRIRYFKNVPASCVHLFRASYNCIPFIIRIRVHFSTDSFNDKWWVRFVLYLSVVPSFHFSSLFIHENKCFFMLNVEQWNNL